MLKSIIVALVLLVARGCYAAPHPHPIHWVKHHKLLIVSSAIMVAADVADTRSTIHFLASCPTCVETSDLYGPRPSHARLWSESAAFDAGYIWIDWFGTKDTGLTGTKDFTPEEKAAHPVLYKMVWMEKPAAVVLIGFVAFGHARAAYHNAQLPFK